MLLSTLLSVVLGSILPSDRTLANPSFVRLDHSTAGYRLLFDGKPYPIKGAGGDGSMKMLAAAGGNSLRTWGADNLGDVLEEARRNHLTVAAGIWLQHTDGMNYNDASAVKKQFDMCRDVVRQYRDSPSLLLWSIGNEEENEGDDAAIWKAVEDIAKMIHSEDPNHPVMTVVSEGKPSKIQNLNKYCPDIDIVGINSYAPAPTLPKRYRDAGGVKPYILTEYGVRGWWESGKTSWGAPYELTSTEKMAGYREAYQANVVGNESLCLGSYAFLWSHKIEGTPTWFGMFTPDNAPTGAVDVVSEMWTGRPVADPAPTIGKITIAGGDTFSPGQKIRALVEARIATANRVFYAGCCSRRS